MRNYYKIESIWALLLLPITLPAITSYDWPTGTGEAILSNTYAVTVSRGPESHSIEVLLSESWTEPGGGPDIFRDRTFSWAAFADPFDRPLVVRVEKLFGEPATEVEIVPSAYNLVPLLSEDGRSVTLLLDRPRYFSVNFKTADNLHAPDGLITHMLMVFADPPETDVPDPEDAGVHLFSQATTQADVDAAELLYFAPGFHDLRGQFPEGILNMTEDSRIYISGGAFITGKFDTANRSDRTRIWGRGAISGRDYPWESGQPISALIEASGNDVVIEGIFAMDNNKHGVVPGWSATLRRVKVWGWHYNNDGFRPWGGLVESCFTRPADDAFYVGGRDLVVRDTVVWQSFNGAVVTCGWGSADNPYNTSGFWMEDSHIIYPEWNGIGNNNGILASQLPYTAISDDIHFERIRIDGNVSALTNLKRNEDQPKTVPAGRSPGGIFNLSFTDVTVTGRQITYNYNRTQVIPSKSLVRGEDQFRIENLNFTNLSIDGQWVTESNRDQFFTIDPVTTSGITFASTPVPVPESIPVGKCELIIVKPSSEAFACHRFFGQYGSTYRMERSADSHLWAPTGPLLVGWDEEILIPLPVREETTFYRIRLLP